MYVILPTKTLLKVEHIGDVFISNDLVLKDVLYIPDFKYNLLLVSTLLKYDKFAISFVDSNCLSQDKWLSKTIGKAELTNGPYLLRMKNEIVNCIQHTTLMCKVSASMWHKRMGHPSIRRIKELAKIEISDFPNCKEVCHICPLAKQRRLSFPILNNIAENVFDLIHCDIWGPFKTPTHAGHSYFATIVDDKSRYTWVYLLKHKSDILQVIPRFSS